MSRCLRSIGSGMVSDLKRRIPFYLNDWREGFHPRIPAACLFMFFTSIAPAITFGSYLQDNTGNHIGVIEVLLATSISGIIYALFAGQPLVILGVSGPISIFTITVYQISEALEINFLAFQAWIGFWAGFMHLVLALINACSLVRYVTRFSCETFAILIAVIYIANAIEDFVVFFRDETLAAAFVSLLIAIGTFWVAITLDAARKWNILFKIIRIILADYATVIAILIFTGFSYVGSIYDANPPRLNIPDNSEPILNELTNLSSTFVDTSSNQTDPDTEWHVPFWDLPIAPFWDIPGWAILVAIGPGVLLTLLFYFDHNVSSLLTQRPEANLKKGSSYHWDFFVLGFIVIICSLLGLPATNGLIPQAPLHTRSLASIEEKIEYIQKKIPKSKKKSKSSDEDFEIQEEITIVVEKKIDIWSSVYENRLSNFLQALLIGIMINPDLIHILRWVPRGVFSGVFLYMGFSSFYDNQFAERLLLLVTDPIKRRSIIASVPHLSGIPFRVTAVFTVIQLFLWAIIFGVTESQTPAAIAFPLFIALLVPARIYLFPKIPFLKMYLPDLDGFQVDSDDGKEELDLESDTPIPDLACDSDEPDVVELDHFGKEEEEDLDGDTNI